MPSTGHFILHSNVLPQLTAGSYQLVSDQADLPFDVAAEETHVTVSSPRFTMPTDQILSTFPPANAEGAFGDRLPQIALKRRTLPWERNPAGQVAPSPTPWLALVVVAEGEAELSSTTPVANCVTDGVALLDPTDHDVEQGLYLAVTRTVVRKIFPTIDDLALLVHVREVDVNDTELANGDDDGWLAVVLANRLPVAEPSTGNPVRYMACLVNVEGQLDKLPVPTPPSDNFVWELAQDWRALATVDTGVGPDSRVMGGFDVSSISLPGTSIAAPGDAARAAGPAAPVSDIGAAREKNAMHGSVNMDGTRSMLERSVGSQWSTATEQVTAAALDPDARLLVRDRMARGFRLPISVVALEPVYRFPVLAHWSFTTRGLQTFETLMRDLDVGLLGTIEQEAGVVGNSPAAAPPPRPAPEVVETGHIGLAHRTRRGDSTRAWYRGPLVPFPSKRDYLPGNVAPPLAHDADQLRRVIPDGREDLSLAAGFEIGRLLGLSQLSVVSALLRFRAEQFGVARARELAEAFAGATPPPAGAVRIDLGRLVSVGLMGKLADDTARVLGPRRPMADPGRPLEVKGDLDRVIADGLGLDLDSLRRNAEKVGLMKALSLGTAPVAMPEGGKVLDERGRAALRSALDSTLERVVAVAEPAVIGPPVIVAPPRSARARRTAAAAPPPPSPDPLDQLIASAAELEEEEE